FPYTTLFRSEVCQPKLKKWCNDAVPRFLQQQTKRGGGAKIRRSTHPEKWSGEIRRILDPARMPLEYRRGAKLIGDKPDEKACWNQRTGQHCQRVSANRCAAKNFRPHPRVRNQSANSCGSFCATDAGDELYFSGPFE